MKHSYPYYLLGLALFFASCESERNVEALKNTTLQGSIDAASLHEGGPSNISYNSNTKENVIVYTDYYFLGIPMTHESVDGTMDTDNGPKPAAAANTDAGGVSLRYGLEYVGKGAKFPGIGSNNGINLNYLEVPLDAIYHYPAGPGSIEAGLGPYFAYGLGGQTGGQSSFGQANAGFKRFDAGLNLQAGYQFDIGLSVRLGYDLGLANVEEAGQDVTGHTRTFSINIGYQIGRLFGKK